VRAHEERDVGPRDEEQDADDGRARERRPPSRERPAAARDQHGRGRGDREQRRPRGAPRQPGERRQDEARDERSHHRADGVDGVQAPDARAEVSHLAPVRGGGEREDAAHEERGRQQDHRAREDELQDVADARVAFASRDGDRHLPEPAADRVVVRERHEHRRGEDADRHVEPHEHAHRVRRSRGDASEREAAEREPEEERREHRAERVREALERERQEPRPEHLGRESDQARREGRHERGAHRGRRLGVRPPAWLPLRRLFGGRAGSRLGV
jgi:hypothetical protein